jgi:Flp pilus assembly protein TadD
MSTGTIAVTVLLLVAACSPARPADASAGGDELSAEVLARLDSASAAYRASDFASARDHYQAVVRLAPDLAAAWFGLYLAERALGRTAPADSALRIARRLATGDSARTRSRPGS